MSDGSDQTLYDVVTALQGDKGSLERLLARYHGRLAAVAIKAGAYRMVDDVVQDALIKIFGAIQNREVTIDSVEQFRGWTHTVAHNTAIDHLRREGRQMRHVDSVLGGSEHSAPAERVAANDLSPSMHAHLAERMSELRRSTEARDELVAKLRRPDQILVRMRERDGLTFPQIAVELGAIVGRELTADAMRIRYGRLVADKLGPPVGDDVDGVSRA